MTRPICVFLGPTLERDVAARILDADYHPPVEQGSLVALVTKAMPSAIVLIDGVFAKAPAVRHKEILWTLNRGIPVIGASSMGALRAAELHACGMVGHGWIYRWYRATPFIDDDEVAVAMTPSELGATALSEALINMRLTFRKAERAKVIERSVRIALEHLAASIHFLDRTYPSVFEAARHALGTTWIRPSASLPAWVENHAVDRKRADAVSVLRWLAQAPLLRYPSLRSAPFRMTEAWLTDLADAGLSVDP